MATWNVKDIFTNPSVYSTPLAPWHVDTLTELPGKATPLIWTGDRWRNDDYAEGGQFHYFADAAVVGTGKAGSNDTGNVVCAGRERNLALDFVAPQTGSYAFTLKSYVHADYKANKGSVRMEVTVLLFISRPGPVREWVIVLNQQVGPDGVLPAIDLSRKVRLAKGDVIRVAWRCCYPADQQMCKLEFDVSG